MIRTLFRRGLRIGAVVGVILFLVQVFLRNPPPSNRTGTESRPGPRPAQRRSEPASKTATRTTQKGADAPSKPPSRAAGSAKAPATPSQPSEPAGSTRSTGKTAQARAGGKTASKRATKAAAWVEPTEGVCPTTHPVKVKLASGIFHLPGGLAYERTVPDRCYSDEAAAEADGFRPSKR